MFENISIGIKTFLRDEQLFNTIHAIRKYYKNTQMIIADCGEMTEEKDGLYADLVREGHIHIDLPFDAGFGRMSNAIADRLTRPYLLMGSDDFDFSTNEAFIGVKNLVEVLENNRYVDIASGRVNDRPYEFMLTETDGVITEVLAAAPRPSIMYPYYINNFYNVDLTVNYFLARNKVFDSVRWDDDVKIGGGEHGSMFLDLKRAGFKTVYVPGVNINEQQVRNSSRYNMYRRRAADPARPCFVKRGVKRYVLGNGVVDYQEA